MKPCLNRLFLAVGKKEDGEDGISFENEDEKEQWEEDQRVSVRWCFLNTY